MLEHSLHTPILTRNKYCVQPDSHRQTKSFLFQSTGKSPPPRVPRSRTRDHSSKSAAPAEVGLLSGRRVTRQPTVQLIPQAPFLPTQPWCPSEIFCAGPVSGAGSPRRRVRVQLKLDPTPQTVNAADLCPDQKTLIDKPTNEPPDGVLTDFSAINGSNPSYGQVQQLVDTDFFASSWMSLLHISLNHTFVVLVAVSGKSVSAAARCLPV